MIFVLLKKTKSPIIDRRTKTLKKSIILKYAK